jgi:hypothetical protein
MKSIVKTVSSTVAQAFEKLFRYSCKTIKFIKGVH